MRDDLADGTPPLDPPAIGFDDLAGNHVVEDLGGGRFALYAHLRHGSVRVHTGDVVARGDVLGHVGNSGNSSEPHLHFHVMDAAGGPSALEADGLPYAFDAFGLEARLDEFAGPGPLEPLRPGPRTGALPLAGEVVDFG